MACVCLSVCMSVSVSVCHKSMFRILSTPHLKSEVPFFLLAHFSLPNLSVVHLSGSPVFGRRSFRCLFSVVPFYRRRFYLFFNYQRSSLPPPLNLMTLLLIFFG